MGLLNESLDKISAVCVGATAMAFGLPNGTIEAAVGIAGLTAFVLNQRQKFGPECTRVRRRIQQEVTQSYSQYLKMEVGGAEASENLDAVAAVLEMVLARCMLDRTSLARAAVSPEGFVENSTALILSELEKVDPGNFAVNGRSELLYRFSKDVIAAGLTEAAQNRDYYRALEPALMFTLARAVGTIQSTLDAVSVGQRRQDAQSEQLIASQLHQAKLLERIAAKLGVTDSSEVSREISGLELELNSTKSELLALLYEIIGSGVEIHDISAAVAKAKQSLDQTRAQLEALLTDANEPEVLDQLRKAKAALADGHDINLQLAESSLRSARQKLESANRQRQERESRMHASLLAAEAELSNARGRHIAAADLYKRAALQVDGHDISQATIYRAKGALSLSDFGHEFLNLNALKTAVFELESIESSVASSVDQTVLLQFLEACGSAYLGIGQILFNEEAIGYFEKALRCYQRSVDLDLALQPDVVKEVLYYNVGLAMMEIAERSEISKKELMLSEAVTFLMKGLRESGYYEEKEGITFIQLKIINKICSIYARQNARSVTSDEIEEFANILPALQDAIDGYGFQHDLKRRQDLRLTLASGYVAYSMVTEGRKRKKALKAGIRSLALETDTEWAHASLSTHVIALNTYANLHLSLAEQEHGTAREALLRRVISIADQSLALLVGKNGQTAWVDAQSIKAEAALRMDSINYNSGIDAEEMCRALLSKVEKESAPVHWALAKNRLALALKISAEQTGSGVAKLEEAVEHLSEALTIPGVESEREMWVGMMRNCGVAHRTLAHRLSPSPKSKEHAISAISFLENALRPQNTRGKDWAGSIDDLGIAYAVYASISAAADAVPLLHKSIECHRAALDVRSEAIDRTEWKVSAYNLANALMLMGDRTASPQRTEFYVESRSLFRSSIFDVVGPVYRKVPGSQGYHLARLSYVLAISEVRKKKYEVLQDAIDILRSLEFPEADISNRNSANANLMLGNLILIKYGLCEGADSSELRESSRLLGAAISASCLSKGQIAFALFLYTVVGASRGFHFFRSRLTGKLLGKR